MPDLKSVLIVDDSALSRRLIRGFIERKYPQCVVYEAPTGDDAIKMAAVQAPQLITLDVNMPGMDSFEAASQLRKLCPSARMAVITANIQQSVRKKLQGLGILFLAIVEKPVTEGGIQRMLDAM